MSTLMHAQLSKFLDGWLVLPQCPYGYFVPLQVGAVLLEQVAQGFAEKRLHGRAARAGKVLQPLRHVGIEVAGDRSCADPTRLDVLATPGSFSLFF